MTVNELRMTVGVERKKERERENTKELFTGRGSMMLLPAVVLQQRDP